ncbi:aspartyl-phosphate phosphatase Spo0E family protein [Clostridium omnivorum]|uniref:Aspartyl-phosphate phosphatase Spo0E family protein n=1 Tax=Clostridium omnivorum TaxID=1604902 RepID=A0ABQ5NAA8_9CLOT|nr:aspartyl-phosphate phosphatase Spo0E family protein [Clostridium sp. E14]GLC32148.1 hypothetical protein bsdE14_35580 [Clostridium sp. E14]
MEYKLQILIDNIEKLRNLLYNLLTSNNRLTDEKVVDCSQQLDRLLVEYEKYRNNTSPRDAA